RPAGLHDDLCLVVLDGKPMKRLREGLIVRIKQEEIAAAEGLFCRLEDKAERTIARSEQAADGEASCHIDTHADEEKESEKGEPGQGQHGVRGSVNSVFAGAQLR